MRTYNTDFKIEIGELVEEWSYTLEGVVFKDRTVYAAFISALRSCERAFSAVRNAEPHVGSHPNLDHARSCSECNPFPVND